MKALFLLFFIMYCTVLAPAMAQDPVQQVDCSTIVDSNDVNKASASYQCLEKRLNDMVSVVNSILKIATSLSENNENLKREIERLQTELNGPKKQVAARFDDVKVATTIGYWAGGSETFQCVPPPQPPPGYVVYGMDYGLEVSQWVPGLQLCPGPGWCDGGKGEYCHYKSRSRGCYISQEWLDWFKRQAAKFQFAVTYDNVCGS